MSLPWMRLIIRKNNIYGFKAGDMHGFWDISLLLTGRGGVYPQKIPGLCHWMPLIIRNNNIHVYGLGVPGIPLRNTQFTSFDVSYHKEQLYGFGVGIDPVSEI